MDFLLPRVACLIMFIYMVQGIRLYVQPPQFYEYDENVQLVCSVKDEDFGRVLSVNRIRLEIKNGTRWDNVAYVGSDGLVEGKNEDMTFDGHVGRPEEAFLLTTWPVVVPSFFGTYRCDFFYESSSGDYDDGKTEGVYIQGLKRSTHNLFDLVRHNNRNVVEKIDEVLARARAIQLQEKEKFEQLMKNGTMLLESLTSVHDLIRHNIIRKLSEFVSRLANIEQSLGKMNTTLMVA